MKEMKQEKRATDMPPVTIETPRQLRLSDQQIALLQRVFVTMTKVQVLTEFTDGRTNTRVLLVRPTRPDGVTELPVVVKMGFKTLIDQEWQATQGNVLHLLPGFVPVQGEPVYLAATAINGQTLGAIRYAQVGDGIFKIQSLRDYYQQAEVQQIWRLLNQRLFPQLGQLWQATLVQRCLTVQHHYDAILPVNFVIQLHEAATSANITLMTTLNAESLPALLADAVGLVAGHWVRLAGFIVQEIDPMRREVTLDLTALDIGVKATYRIRLQSVDNLDRFIVGERIPPTVGEILATRADLLCTQVQAHLGKIFDLAQPRLTIPGDTAITLPNPLTLLPKLLQQTIETYSATIHGDLNLRNILVDPDAHSTYIIDGAAAQQDHLLHDLLRLERDVITDLLAETFFQANLSPHTICMLYRYVHCATCGQARPPGDFAIPSELPPVLQKIFVLLVIVRETARRFLTTPQGWDEYYTGLCIHLLGALKFKDLDSAPAGQHPKAIAFWGAASVAEILTGELPCQGITWTRFDLNRTSIMRNQEKTTPVPKNEIKHDNRSGVYFEGNKEVNIKGNIISGGTVNQATFHAPVIGPVHTGSGDLHVGTVQNQTGPNLNTLFANLRNAIKSVMPETIQIRAMQRTDELHEAIQTLDLGMIESVFSWFQRQLPLLEDKVAVILFHPVVVQRFITAGEPLLFEYWRRFQKYKPEAH